jgi:BlaI family transcriptional regulator, penicillinase repressor
LGRVKLPGGELEYAILAGLWELGSATARDVHMRASQPHGLAYTTTATVLDRLHAKGLVSRARVARAFVYRPRVGREVVERARLREALDWLLGTKPQPAMARLVDAVESIRPSLVEELGREVAKRRRKQRGS